MSDASARDQGRDKGRDAMSMAAMSSERIEPDDNVWTRRLVLFLRIMAVISILKGLYHWAQVTGFIGGEEEAFENQSMAWQTATVYFAVIELVAARSEERRVGKECRSRGSRHHAKKKA